MARRDDITNRRGLTGNLVSHSKRHTKRTQELNLQTKRFKDPVTGQTVTLRVSTRTLKTIAKNGLAKTVRKNLRG